MRRLPGERIKTSRGVDRLDPVGCGLRIMETARSDTVEIRAEPLLRVGHDVYVWPDEEIEEHWSIRRTSGRL